MKIKISSNFDKVCENFKKHIAQQSEQQLGELGLYALSRIQLLTPVDTGRARGGWRFARDGRYTMRVFNNVHYIIYLEYGHSQQAPHGMVRLTAAHLQRILARR